MQIGALGDVVFETSRQMVRTFNNVERSNQARWAVHDIIGEEPMPEFIGPGQKEISLPIQLNILLLGGGSIEDELETIETMVDSGKVSTLVIGERIFGKYYIESMSDSTPHLGGRGEFLTTELTLTLKKYPERTTLR